MKRMLIPLGLLAMTAGASTQNLLVNGDFSLSVPNSGFGNGWTGVNNDGAGGWRATGGNPGGSYILNWNGSSINPQLYQDVVLTVGQTYRISGDYSRGNIGSFTTLDFGVEIDGNLWEYDIPNSTTWLSFSNEFVATTTNARLLLTGERYGDDDPRVDNMVLEAVVPEPTTIAAVGLGFVALLRKRRQG
jgi:hypothetical protein